MPLPTPLLVKNGSKIRGRISSGMPLPVSSTSSQTPPSPHPVRRVRDPPSDGVAGVEDEVHHDLDQLAAVHLHGQGLRRGLEGEADVLAHEAPQHLARPEHDFVELEPFRLRAFPAGEEQELTGQSGTPPMSS